MACGPCQRKAALKAGRGCINCLKVPRPSAQQQKPVQVMATHKSNGLTRVGVRVINKSFSAN